MSTARMTPLLSDVAALLTEAVGSSQSRNAAEGVGLSLVWFYLELESQQGTASRLCRCKSRSTTQLKSNVFQFFPLISVRHQMSRTSFLHQKPSRVEFSISQRPSSHFALCSFLLWPCAFPKRRDRKHYEEQGMPFHRMTDAAVHPKEGQGTTESAFDSQLSLTHSLNQGRAPTQPSQLLGLQPNEMKFSVSHQEREQEEFSVIENTGRLIHEQCGASSTLVACGRAAQHLARLKLIS
ncbi:uncharacterized protein LOC118170633 [Oxyura jamaicensis]|uniref:uncharacterized protein LOC118170633 n=1 Tax=Oxyura jamaicensis TaxID=8884 RepID=UPI0015A6733A|nr:uncharacterized protein LOC118170633 [Oxyura jamaicensis]